MKKIIFLFLTGLLFIQNVYSADPKAKRVRFTPAGTIEATNVQDAIEEVASEGGGAPTDATYITQTANGTLTAEQALGTLSTGILKSTTTTGVVSIAVSDTDYDSSVTNEINTIQGDDNVATSGLAISIDGAGIVTTDVVDDILTITGTEADTLDTVSDRGATTDQTLITGGITTTGVISGGTLTDSTLSITGGNITSAAAITASGQISGGTLTDGTLLIQSGDITNAGNITGTGTLTTGTLIMTELAASTDTINDTHIDFGTGANQVSAADIPIALGSGSPTVDQIQEYLDNTGSSGFSLGGELSDGGSGTLNVAAGSGFIRTTNDDNAQLESFKWSASSGIAVPDDTTQYVYVDDDGVISLSTDEFLEAPDKIQIGVVTDEAASTIHVFNLGVRLEESIGAAGRFIRRVHGIARNNRKGGLIYGQSGDANRDVTMTAGELEWGRTTYVITSFDTSGADTFSTYSAGGQEAAAASQWPNEQFDSAGTLTTMTNNRWANLFFYIEPDDHIVMIYGRAQFTSQALAEGEGVPSTSLPSKVSETGILAARFTFQKSSNTAVISSAFDELFANAGVTDHGNLAGLADDDHMQYITADGTTPLTANWDVGAFAVTAKDLTLDGTLTDGTLSITGGNITSAANITATKQIQGGTLTDGTLLIQSGNITNIGTLAPGTLLMTTSVNTILDEDAMGTDSATALATQQSIKKYVDDNAGGQWSQVGNIVYPSTIATDQVGIGSTFPINGLFHAGTGLQEGLTVTSQGWVGIGITTPTVALDVVGSILASKQIQAGTITDGTLIIDAGDIASAVNITATKQIQGGTLTDGTLLIQNGIITGASSITSTALVGTLTGNADTVTTNANLTGDVTSSGNATTIADSVAVTSWNLTTPTLTTSATITDDDWIGLGSTAGRIQFNDTTIDAIGFLSSNVGIGTTNPSEKLQVAGGILGNTLSDGTLLIQSGKITSAVSITSNTLTVGAIILTGGTLTDGTLNIGGGVITGATLTAAANVIGADTVATITGLAPDTATTQATQAAITSAANLTTVGALNAGSITSGFTSIDVGAGAITTTGQISGGTLTDGTVVITGGILTGATSMTAGALVLSTAGNISGAKFHITPVIVDPLAVQTLTDYICLIPVNDALLDITKIDVSLDAATNQIDASLIYADTYVGLANSVVMNSLLTVGGTFTDSTLTVGSLPPSKALIIKFNAAPHTDILTGVYDLECDYR